MNIFRIKTGDETLYNEYRNGASELLIDHLIQYNEDIRIGDPVFLSFGGDGTPWLNGLYCIAKIKSNPLELGYEKAKRGDYYKLKVEILVRLKNPLEKKALMRYPETFDSGIGPSTKGERNQALGMMDEISSKAICRAILDVDPSRYQEIESVFGTDFVASVQKDVKVYADASVDKIDILSEAESRKNAFRGFLIAEGRFKRSSTGKNYWSAMQKADAQFVVDILKDKVNSSYENIFYISQYDEADKLWNLVKKDPRNVAYQNMVCSSFLGKYKDFLNTYNCHENLEDEGVSISDDFEKKILFGAPGTGKSHKIDCDLFKDANGNPLGIGLKSISQDRKFRTTFHPDYDYAQFVGSYKPKSVCDTSSVGIQDPGNLSIDDLIDIAKKMHDDEIAHPYARLGILYYKSLNALSKSVVGAKKEICDKSGNGMDNGPELNTGIFIGEYLEENIVSKETKIIYSFVPQVFAKAYVEAWKRNLSNDIPEDKKSVYLVIEEINRGNCAQIFGDIFQLLDRKDGHSEYPIDVDSDFATYIRETLGDKFAAYKEKICSYMEDAAIANATPDEEFCKIALPPNFNILATMNTSDQSLFPMDSAFKRRFDWEYVPIDYMQENAKFFIEVGDTKYSWLDFLKAVNKDIAETTLSEDKQMGEFFVKPSKTEKDDKGNEIKVIDLDMFRSKVLFYLWDSVYKDETSRKKVFHFEYKDGSDDKLTFQTLFEGTKKEQISLVKKIFEKLGFKTETNGGAGASSTNDNVGVVAEPENPENTEA